MSSKSNNVFRQLHHFFEKSVVNYPNNIALVCDNVSLTYLELDRCANQLAHRLLQNKIAKGSVVGVLLERSLESYVSILALLKVGAVYVPIEVEYPDERINYILNDLPFQAVLTSASQRKRTQLDLPLTLVLNQETTLTNNYPQQKPQVADVDEEQLCYIIYTSGSTGRPKGVEITHRSICHYVAVAGEIYAMTLQDKVYQGFSLAFDASMEEVWMAFAHGATLVACTDKDTRSGVGLLDFLQHNKITVFSTVPTLLSSLEGTMNSVRLLILGGEACTTNLISRWMRPDLSIMNTYGPTEATVIATYVKCELDKEVTIGQPLPGYQVYILDEKGQLLTDGSTGELCIGGRGLARGYVNRPELMSLKFIAHPEDAKVRLYRTGDLAYKTETGDIQFAGRVDDQIKLRGFRIELNEIESTIIEYEGVAQAVVALHVMDQQPNLVAYVSVNKNTVFDESHFKRFLSSRLPDYMMPSLFEWLDTFPLLASGKIDRKALPKPNKTVIDQNYSAPKTKLEQQVAAIMQQCLQLDKISVDANFFSDLGGHSLSAAKFISLLRKDADFATISILDLYNNPTIRQLASNIEQSATKHKAQAPTNNTNKHKVSNKSYFLCGLGQFFGCLFQYGISAWQLLLVVVGYLWLTTQENIFSFASITLFISLIIFMPLVSFSLAIVAKWLLLGRVKPGEYPLWGWFYFRWWLVQGIQDHIVQTKYYIGTPIINLYYRLLGAKIGANSFIGTGYLAVPDLVTIGSGSTLSNEVRMLGYVVEDGLLKVGRIDIGSDCYVGARSVLGINTTVADAAVLDDMSMLSNGSVVAANQFYAGSPARKITAPDKHVTRQHSKIQKPSKIQTIIYGVLHYLALSIESILYYISFIPSIMILDYFYEQGSLAKLLFLATPLAAFVFLIAHYAMVCITKKIILGKPKPGTYLLNSLYYVRQLMVLRIVGSDEIGVLADSIFFPMLLRMLGAKLGKQVEMGETPHLIPDFITIEKGGFSASGVGMAWPVVYRGFVSYGSIKVDENAFVGNVSLLPQGTHLGRAGLLGCMTIPPSNNRAAQTNSYWLGSPPMYLPTREIFGGFPDELTYNPPIKLYLLRMLIEIIRVILPTTCGLILLCSMFSIVEYLLQYKSMLTTLLVLPLAECGINLVLVSGLIALKWLLVGRIKPCIKPLWDKFIWKNDIREFSYGYYINPHLTDVILGTPFISILYRAMGAKIGKRVFINTEGFAEFDLISIGDEVCINRDTLIQTHLYEDRIFKLGALRIEDGCNVGVGSMVLYDTVMQTNSTLGSLSLLMKGESLPANTCWEGSPAQSIASSEELPIAEPVTEVESVLAT